MAEKRSTTTEKHSTTTEKRSTTTEKRLTMTERQAVLKSVGPSHYLVRFVCDECVSVVPRKNILEPTVPTVGDMCQVEWMGDNYEAKLLALGDESTVKKKELEYLEATGEVSASDEENQPPKKKRRIFKSLAKGKKAKKSAKVSTTTQKRGRKPFAEVQNVKKKSVDFDLDLGSPAKGLPPSPKEANQPNKTSEVPIATPPPVNTHDLSFSSFSSFSDSGSSDILVSNLPNKVITVYDDSPVQGNPPKKQDKCSHVAILEAVASLASSVASMEERIISSISVMESRVAVVMDDVASIKKQQERIELAIADLSNHSAPVQRSQQVESSFADQLHSTPKRKESDDVLCISDSLREQPTGEEKSKQIHLESDFLVRLHNASASRRNFAANLMRELFNKAEREASNVNGKLGKSQLDPKRIEYIRSTCFKMYPLEAMEKEKTAWSACVNAIDEANRRLYRKK